MMAILSNEVWNLPYGPNEIMVVQIEGFIPYLWSQLLLPQIAYGAW